MVKTSSTMLPLGSLLPEFDLKIVKGTSYSKNPKTKALEKFSDKLLDSRPVLFMVICAHCPFVKHIESCITRIDKDHRDSLQIIAISSNSLITHPQDSPKYLAEQANFHGWSFPYLFDEEQSFAKSLKAACTPDFFLFSSNATQNHYLKYRGQLDESRPGNNVAVSGKDLIAAIDAILHDRNISSEQRPSIGCNIKWHPGEEPSWFG